MLIACGECLAADPFGGGTASQNLLKGCNYNRAEVAALVISEMLSAKDKAVERPGVAPNQLFNLQKVCPAPLPVYRKNLFKHRSPMEANFVADFDLVDMMAAKVRPVASPALPHASQRTHGHLHSGAACASCCRTSRNALSALLPG